MRVYLRRRTLLLCTVVHTNIPLRLPLRNVIRKSSINRQSNVASVLLEVYWPCAGGVSAVNAIGTPLCDPINLGLTRWRMAVSLDAAAELGRNPVREHQIQPEYGDEQADAGRDG